MPSRSLLAALMLLAGCQGLGQAPTDPNTLGGSEARVTPPHHAPYQPTDEPVPADQLLQVKQATAVYNDIRHALADGYHDIGVVIPNMGRHFAKDSLFDANFDLEHPELLVYTPDEQGRMVLVAVEYAVPDNLTSVAPEGFRGGADQWFDDPNFHLWTLHAWVWKENPDGVFNPTNSKVP